MKQSVFSIAYLRVHADEFVETAHVNRGVTVITVNGDSKTHCRRALFRVSSSCGYVFWDMRFERGR